MNKLELLLYWRKNKIKEAVINNDELFLGIPDSWYNDITFICKNGHIR